MDKPYIVISHDGNGEKRDYTEFPDQESLIDALRGPAFRGAIVDVIFDEEREDVTSSYEEYFD